MGERGGWGGWGGVGWSQSALSNQFQTLSQLDTNEVIKVRLRGCSQTVYLENFGASIVLLLNGCV